MGSRCFAFGCSYTKWIWPTWADFVGVNFDNYYNGGRGGASNSYIMNKLIEADHQYKFDPATDYVIIMLTGINRFSFYHNNDWRTFGEMSDYVRYKDGRNVSVRPYFPKLQPFATDLWNLDWAIYNTWISVVAMKNLLVAKNIPHKIVIGIKTNELLPESGVNAKSVEKLAEVNEIVDIAYGLYPPPQPVQIEFRDGTKDGHPSIMAHHKYANMHFPQFNTDISAEFYKTMTQKMDMSSPNACATAFEKSLLEYKNIKRI
jgi:hypothetical protein